MDFASDSNFSGPGAVRFRVAGPADRHRLVPLINAAFALEDFLEGDRTDEQRLAEVMSKGEILAAEDPFGRIVACVYLERRGRRGYFGMLSVDPPLQGRGLGRLLTSAAEESFRREGMEAVEIIVLSFRTELPAYYQRLGYRIVGTREFKPGRPLKPGVECHGIVMTKTL